MGTIKKTAKKSSKYTTSDGHSYFTKRILVTKARIAGKKAASNAMDVMGYVVVAEGGNIVKKDADGKIIEIIAEVGNENQDVALD